MQPPLPERGALKMVLVLSTARASVETVQWCHRRAVPLCTALTLPHYHCVAGIPGLPPGAPEPSTQYLFSPDSKLQDAHVAQDPQETIERPFAMQLLRAPPDQLVHIIPPGAYGLYTHRPGGSKWNITTLFYLKLSPFQNHTRVYNYT